MPRFETSRRVLHNASHMFDLVADVERYPEFVPLCQSLRIRSRGQDQEHEHEVIVATMTVAYKLLRESFTTRIVLDRPARRICVSYIDGPFKHLENVWSFKPLDEESCQIGFHITYEFRSRLLQSLMGAAFDRAFRKFADAFEARADEIYGRKGKSVAGGDPTPSAPSPKGYPSA